MPSSASASFKDKAKAGLGSDATQGGPNGWKIVFAFEELGLSYETTYFDFQSGEHKKPEVSHCLKLLSLLIGFLESDL